MSMYVNVGGVWKESPPKVNVGGTWKDVETGWVNADGVWKPFFKNAGKYQLLADITVSSDTTQVNITGLNLTKDSEYMLVSDLINSVGATTTYYLCANANTTLTNYYTQQLYATGATVGTDRSNIPYLFGNDNGQRALSIAHIRLTNSGYFSFQNNIIDIYGGSSVKIANRYCTSTFTAPSITSLTILASRTSGVSGGSRFQLYEIGGA